MKYGDTEGFEENQFPLHLKRNSTLIELVLCFTLVWCGGITQYTSGWSGDVECLRIVTNKHKE